jgi:DNA-binding NarL/FixJ family response regulator
MLPAPVETRLRTLKLLIADDRPRTRGALRALLRAYAGFEVVGEATDGAEALAQVEALRPELVLLDVWMPRLDGIAATAHIKARWPAIRVVVHSVAIERRADALAAGADAFVPKGGRPDELLGALGALIPAD